MRHIRHLLPFVKPYWRRALAALFLLTSLVFMDLAIPRLIQRLIDEGINQQDGTVVLRTSLLMLGISAVSTLFAVGNNIFSVQVGEGVAAICARPLSSGFRHFRLAISTGSRQANSWCA